MAVTTQMIKELRARTGAGMMDCKKALEECGGDMDKAVAWLRQKGLAVAAKRAGRATSEGTVAAYIHAGGKLGAMVEVNCETDFVAKTQEFKQFAHDIAMQIAAASPLCVQREDLSEEVIEKEKEIYRAQARESGKPEKIIEKIVEGKLEKFYKEVCLLEQAFIKNPEITIQDLLNEMMAKTGEKIVIRRFARFAVGEEA
ncbi:translation elongation factor Ts [Thermosulfuriphilus ammonigenes]|uniref:Elongation factor Ts n=1 Tax=Thermosulfuriphilus ammonigenes TaxID=1936021 RepID=A0A6G7PX05_9BACT|nr:translation elongation factor Ts [Thermosulfuriphilus ammonigenes]MBA2849678.1 elongation factor Ts [Thermosulfuriphilus ammonigenes]QIJ72225.1 translation elongation factor Ts [Thermosulfuriphilus ammonigenes]